MSTSSLKEIQEKIKNINSSQKKLNSSSISKEINTDISSFINRRLTKSAIKSTTTKEFINSSSSDEIVDMSENNKEIKNDLIVFNKNAAAKYTDKVIDKFVSESLPKLTSVCLVYDYKDKFDTALPFKKWSSNFSLVDDSKTAFSEYNRNNLVSDKSQFLQYIVDGNIVISEAYPNSITENTKKYAADANNVLIISAADLTESPEGIEAFADAEDAKNAILNSSKYIFWGDPNGIAVNNMKSTKKTWKKEAFDKILFYTSNDGGKTQIDKIRQAFRDDPKSGYAVFNSSFTDDSEGLTHVIPDCLNFLEADKTNKDIKLVHSGALSKEAITAANRAVGNLTIKNVTYGQYTTGKSGDWSVNAYTNAGAVWNGNAWYVDWGKWGGATTVGEGYIGDIIYQMYQNASKDNIYSTSFGRYINRSHTDGVTTKSEMDLQNTTSFDYINATIDRKLHVATCIGFTTYTSAGNKTTGYITSSEETIPSGTRHKLFAVGRLASMEKIIKDGEPNNHKYESNAIQNLIASGPDFMANLYDVYIIKYTDIGNTAKSQASNTPNVTMQDFIALSTAPSILESRKVGTTDDIVGETDKSTLKMFSEKNDFLTRVSSITIPSLKADTIDYSFIGQTYSVPGYILQHDFHSSLNIEMDAGLEYMRLINRMAGLSNSYSLHSDKKIKELKNTTYRPLRTRGMDSKIGILIKLYPGNMFYKSDDNLRRYIIFDNVLFTGGGQVSFDQKNSNLASVTFKFTYESITLGEFPFSKFDYASGDALQHSNLVYMPAIQQRNNTDLLSNINNKYFEQPVSEKDELKNAFIELANKVKEKK